MILNDELSWMNLVRRIRFYLPSGQFYDSDFDSTMEIKEIKKIIGLIASIKKPFNLFYEDKEIPNNNKETLNQLFKEKSYDEIIIIQIHINSKSKNKEGQEQIKKAKNMANEIKTKIYKNNKTKNEINNNQHNLKDIEKKIKYISVFQNYLKKKKIDKINSEKKENNYINKNKEAQKYPNIYKAVDINNNSNKEDLLKKFSEKIKLYKNTKFSSNF